ncbi:unnamed protein product [Paramecium primaurelia]|uniref:Uncharacterized protein n=1 Tax=Paramecium primaurelia TaxID=5886 RepID=A0A8S1N179_PARPR|nr:unnamed protein product [Paramecium primaurelia]
MDKKGRLMEKMQKRKQHIKITRVSSNFIHMGEFNNGKKVGTCEGSYDLEGQEIKIGELIVLGDQFEKQKQVTFVGEYENGKKLVDGIFGLNNMDKMHNIIKYDDNGDGRYQMKSLVLSKKQPVLENVKKVGKWDSNLLDEVMQKSNLVINFIAMVGYMMRMAITIKSVSGLNRILHLIITIQYCLKASFRMVKKLVDGRFFKKLNYLQQSLNKLHNFISGYGSFDKGGDCIQIVNWYHIEDEFIVHIKNEYQDESWIKLEVEQQKRF